MVSGCCWPGTFEDGSKASHESLIDFALARATPTSLWASAANLHGRHPHKCNFTSSCPKIVSLPRSQSSVTLPTSSMSTNSHSARISCKHTLDNSSNTERHSPAASSAARKPPNGHGTLGPSTSDIPNSRQRVLHVRNCVSSKMSGDQWQGQDSHHCWKRVRSLCSIWSMSANVHQR